MRLGRLTVRQRLLGIALFGALLTLVLAATAFVGYQEMQAASDRMLAISRVQRYQQDADMMHDSLRADVLAATATAAAFEAGRITPAVARGYQARIVRDVAADAKRLHADLDAAQRVAVSPELRIALAGTVGPLDEYAARAVSLVGLVDSSLDHVQAALPGFQVQFESLERAQARVTGLMLAASTKASDRADRQAAAARRMTLIAVTVALLGLFVLTWLLGRSIVQSLRKLHDVAGAIVAGDLSARNDVRNDDEVGSLGTALNEMADSLTDALERLRVESTREYFTSQLTSALDVADDESELFEVVERVMAEIAPETPTELLLADSSRAHLQRAAANPGADLPGCPVETPFKCVAVRRGGAVVFDDSNDIDACPMLRRHQTQPCSAVCVPLSFMGRSLGVLHATGPQGSPPSPETAERLRLLATQAGSRIGTVRAFEKSQLQASTDGLTGLLNRRALETATRALISRREPFALVIADLDRFKQLNDTYGHEAGDRALRLFSQTLREHMRDEDLVSRLGGEEFVLVLPGMTASSAAGTIERLRARLAETGARGDTPTFTASYGITDSTEADELDQLLRIADAGLMQAKRDGRDRAILGRDTSAPAKPELEATTTA